MHKVSTFLATITERATVMSVLVTVIFLGKLKLRFYLKKKNS